MIVWNEAGYGTYVIHVRDEQRPFRPGAIQESIYYKHAAVNPLVYFAFVYKW